MKREVPPIVLYGASGHAANMRLEILNSLAPFPLFAVVAFVDDFQGDRGTLLDRIPIVTLETSLATYPDVPYFITVGDPKARRTLADRVSASGGRCTSVFLVEIVTRHHPALIFAPCGRNEWTRNDRITLTRNGNSTTRTDRPRKRATTSHFGVNDAWIRNASS